LLLYDKNKIWVFAFEFFWVYIESHFNQKKEGIMIIQCLKKSEMTIPQEVQQLKLIDLTEKLSNKEESSVSSIIILRWLSLFFCLAFWYGFYKLVTLFIS